MSEIDWRALGECERLIAALKNRGDDADAIIARAEQTVGAKYSDNLLGVVRVLLPLLRKRCDALKISTVCRTGYDDWAVR